MSVHLILGGCGFIGRHVALALHRLGETVVLADIVEPLEEIRDVLPIEFRKVPSSGVQWGPLIDGIDVIHHYAWTTVPATADADPVDDFDDNLRELVRLLEEMRGRRATGNAPRLVFSSSGGTVYGPIRRTPVDEGHPYNPTNAYGASKAAAEIYIGYYRNAHGLDCRVARISNPFGAGQNPTKRQGAASTFLFQALDGRTLSIWGDGEVVRDYIHIADLAEALVVLSRTQSLALSEEETAIFNIGSGEGVSLNKIIDVLKEDLRLLPSVEYLPSRSFDVPISVLDLSKAVRILGWSPRLTFVAGYKQMLSDVLSGSSCFSNLLDPSR